ncbi:PmV-like protein [Aratus pisonii nudivirus]|nr:PmV-like protein [Aratus pisonii nudivirus]
MNSGVINCSETFDTFTGLVADRINKSLSQDEFTYLNSNDEWNDTYFKFFLNLYSQMCNLTGFNYVKHDSKTFEPVTIHVDTKISKYEKPVVLHSISIPFLKWIYDCKCYKSASDNCKDVFSLPSIFPIINSNIDSIINQDFLALDGILSKRLIRYYVFADHAAYHYHNFITYGDADYTHLNIINRPNNIKLKDIKFCHDIITSKPNSSIDRYLRPIDATKVEDVENDDGYVDISYGELFKQ